MINFKIFIEPFSILYSSVSVPNFIIRYPYWANIGKVTRDVMTTSLSSCIVEMVYVVKVINIVGSLYSTMPAPQSQTSLGSLGI